MNKLRKGPKNVFVTLAVIALWNWQISESIALTFVVTSDNHSGYSDSQKALWLAIAPHRGAFAMTAGDVGSPGGIRIVIDECIGAEYPWYVAAGNHDLREDRMATLRALNPGGNTLPSIVNPGPANCEETTYSFRYENCHFVILNQYYDGNSDIGYKTGGSNGQAYISDALYKWLESDLDAARADPKVEHIFVTAHEPLYYVTDHNSPLKIDLFNNYDLGRNPRNRDRFWNLLKQKDVLAFFCGHHHQFRVHRIDEDDVWQVLSAWGRGCDPPNASERWKHVKCTFVKVNVTGGTVKYEAYRGPAYGGPCEVPYTVADSGTLAQSSTAAQAATGDNWRLVISEDGSRIQKANGSDWYWLGDTAWSLFQELNREDAELYFSIRASQGFTVIQAVVIMGWNRGWNDENAYGQRPFHGGDVSNPNDAFWEHVDWIINRAKEHGLYVALLPAWGSYWGKQATVKYARWITNRYKDYDNMIWVNGGDRKVGNAKGLFNKIGNIFHKDEDTLATFHPRGGDASSKHFHNERWLDINMQQSSHGRRDIRADNQVDADLAKTPTKPTLNGEPNYEDHCVGWDKNCAKGTFDAHDVRQLAYWTVFAGATGITYGHVHVWDFYHGGNREDGYEDWKVQVKDPGAVEMGYLANLVMSRPHAGRAPAQHVLTNESPGGLRQRAIMGNGYVFVYTSQGHKIHVSPDELPWEQNKAWWFNPREGKATQIDNVPDGGNYTFDPPGESGEDNDWVLVIDDAGKGWTAPE